ncbi:MAG: cysteine--tRNA ligase [Deltaproteobacteria bacterium]|nr:cysteine--tRNA ligase [Deltaproteobacteria bacterium]
MQRLYDTREGKKVDLALREPGKVGIYVCGVTVYDLCHVGHARTLVAFDVVARHLRARGLEVRLVRNITDVDDKIIRRGHAEGRPAAEVAKHYADAMMADMLALGVAPPDVEPRATEHIADMIEVIRRLEARGLAYAAEGDVYYAVAGFPSYGALSGQSIDALQAGARIEVGEHKRSPLDFALWKGAKPGEPAWPSPWGLGRPGWHIECSAMAHRYLGDAFDIHGGGSDLIFPHHENEIAQSEGAYGSFARYWMHSGMVNFGGEKMSKSLGNVVTIRRVAETHDLEALRLLLISVHYRSPANFTIARDAEDRVVYPELDEAEARLDYFYRTLERLDAFLAATKLGGEPPSSEPASKADAAMDDDFNTAAAIGHLYDAFVLANKLLDDAKALPKAERARTLAAIARDARSIGATLGIMRRPPSEFLVARRERLCVRRKIDGAAVEARIAERSGARARKDFPRADEIRAELKAAGVELMDTPTGTTWRVTG